MGIRWQEPIYADRLQPPTFHFIHGDAESQQEGKGPAEGHGEVGRDPRTEPLPTSLGSLALPADYVPVLPCNSSAGREE